MTNSIDMLIKTIGNMVGGRENFSKHTVTSINELNKGIMHWIDIVKVRDLTVLTVSRYGMGDDYPLGLVVSIHYEDQFVVYPILCEMETLELWAVLDRVVGMLGVDG